MKRSVYILLAIVLLAALVLFLIIPVCNSLREKETPESAEEEVPVDEALVEENPANSDAVDGADKISGELPIDDLTTPGETNVFDQTTPSGQGTSSGQASSQQPVSGTAGNNQGTQTTHTHSVVKDPAVEATCQKSGLTEGSHCSVCGATITPQKTIPISGHNYVSGKCKWCGKLATDEQDSGIIELPYDVLTP